MTLDPASPSRPREVRRGARLLLRALVALLVAVVIGLAVMLRAAPWALDGGMSATFVLLLLRPSAGFLPLVLALWLLFTVPAVLRHLGGVRRDAEQGRGRPDARVRASDGGADARAHAAGPDSDPGPEEERLRIPAGTFRELQAGHRREMAQALDIPWRDELIHDDQSWVVACLEAAQRRAAEARR